MRILWFYMLLLSLSMASAWGASRVMTLEEYLSSVKYGSADFQSAQLQQHASWTLQGEGGLVFAPAFTMEYRSMNDRRPTQIPAYMGNKTQTNAWSFGVAQETRWGAKGGLYYDVTHSVLSGVDPLFVPRPKNYDTDVRFELSLPLWQNCFGRGSREAEQSSQSMRLAESFESKASAQQKIIDAEITFWRLAMLRETQRVRLETLKRTQSLYDFIRVRERLNLDDTSDLLQVESMLKMRTIELESMKTDLQTTELAFNALRGNDENTVSETIWIPTAKWISSLSVPEKGAKRADLIAAEHRVSSTRSSLRAANDKQLPLVEVFSSLSLNGKDSSMGEAVDESVSTKHPNTTLGVRMSVPLDYFERSKIRNAYSQSIVAAEYSLQQRTLDHENAWTNLLSSFSEKRRLLLSLLELETIQKHKLENEKRKQKIGRSTTFQVTSYEQDYLNTELSRIQMEEQVLTLYAQMKLYSEMDAGQMKENTL